MSVLRNDGQELSIDGEAMTPTLGRIRQLVRPASGQRPGRLEVGGFVYRRLKEIANVHDENPWRPAGYVPPPDAVALLYGVPVMPREDMAPGEWRLLDVDGEEIETGRV